MSRPLSRAYFQNLDVCYLAKDLLGKILITNLNGQITSGIIVETEAYRGPDDRASHSYNFRRTPRNETMYRSGGYSYVYICYGIHHLFNIVTAPEGIAHAVLIRALEPLEGLSTMRTRRNGASDNILTKGPGALSEAMGITKSLDANTLWKSHSKISVLDAGIIYPDDKFISSLRIGVESAGESALWPWRYFVAGNRNVSAHKRPFSG